MRDQKDYYETLEVSRSATDADIRKAYRRLARQHHPDVNKNAEAEEQFKVINEAYEVLSDPKKRAAYDRFGRVDGLGGMGADFSGFGFSDIFEDFFGFGMGQSGPRKHPRRGDDLHLDLSISFEEAIFGCENEVEVTRMETCPHCQGSGGEPGTQPFRCPECNGTGEVRRAHQSIFGSFVNVATCGRCHGEGEVMSTPCQECRGQKRVRQSRKLVVSIPGGVDDGTQIRLAGEGEHGIQGGPPGNLYVRLSVKKHRYFQRQGDDILLNVFVNIAQAALSDKITVPTLESETELVLSAGTQTGTTFRLPNMGVPRLRRNGRGDQLVTVHVMTPTDLNEDQKALLQKLSETLGGEVIAQEDRGFFSRVKDALGV